MVEEEWESKGILVVNAYCDDDLDDRDLAFPDSVAAAASRARLALMTTTDLYDAVVALQKGTFEQERFWRVINNSDGICDFPKWGE